MNRIPKDIIVKHLPKFLDLHEISMFVCAFRGVSDMYNQVTHAVICGTTEINKLVKYCPHINSLIVERHLRFFQSPTYRHTKLDNFVVDEDTIIPPTIEKVKEMHSKMKEILDIADKQDYARLEKYELDPEERERVVSLLNYISRYTGQDNEIYRSALEPTYEKASSVDDILGEPSHYDNDDNDKKINDHYQNDNNKNEQNDEDDQNEQDDEDDQNEQNDEDDYVENKEETERRRLMDTMLSANTLIATDTTLNRLINGKGANETCILFSIQKQLVEMLELTGDKAEFDRLWKLYTKICIVENKRRLEERYDNDEEEEIAIADETDKEEDECLMLSKLPIKKIVFAQGIHCPDVLDFPKLEYLEADTIRSVTGFPELRIIKCRYELCQIGDSCPKLEKLYFYGGNRYGGCEEGLPYIVKQCNEFADLPDIPTLEHLKLSLHLSGRKKGTIMDKYPKLTQLSIYGIHFNNTGEDFTRLRILSIESGNMFPKLHLPNLETLTLVMTNISLSRLLPSKSSLKKLNLNNCIITEEEVLLQLQLEELVIVDINSSKLDAIIPKLPLKMLGADNISIRKDTKLPQTLIELELQLNNRPMSYELPPKIQVLNIQQTRFKMSDIIAISKLPLRKLSLNRSNLNDRMLQQLTVLNLYSLSIRFTQVTIPGLRCLKQTQLRKLYYNGSGIDLSLLRI